VKRLALLLLLAFLALAIWLAARGGGARRDPVERLVADMVPIPGRDYRMGKFEVTQAQWEAVMGENPSDYKGADHPVENVSWDDCQAFLEKLNAHPAARASGLVFRLPTEEEWVFACRAGSTNDFCRLADGTEITYATLDRVAWFAANAARRPRWLKYVIDIAEELVDFVHEVNWREAITHQPVGRKEPNAWGLHDMHGNVCEWTETQKTDRAEGECRVLHGGCWMESYGFCMTSLPNWVSPSARNYEVGFRLCAMPNPAASESHAEPAENAEPRLGEAGSPAGGAGERSEPEGVSHAESAAFESHAEPAESAEPRPGEAGLLPEGAAERSEAGGSSRVWRLAPCTEPAYKRMITILFLQKT